MIINGKNYPEIGTVIALTLGAMEVPILDIPMMSDEEWTKLANSPEQIERRKQHSMQKAGEQHG